MNNPRCIAFGRRKEEEATNGCKCFPCKVKKDKPMCFWKLSLFFDANKLRKRFALQTRYELHTCDTPNPSLVSTYDFSKYIWGHDVKRCIYEPVMYVYVLWKRKHEMINDCSYIWGGKCTLLKVGSVKRCQITSKHVSSAGLKKWLNAVHIVNVLPRVSSTCFIVGHP